MKGVEVERRPKEKRKADAEKDASGHRHYLHYLHFPLLCLLLVFQCLFILLRSLSSLVSCPPRLVLKIYLSVPSLCLLFCLLWVLSGLGIGREENETQLQEKKAWLRERVMHAREKEREGGDGYWKLESVAGRERSKLHRETREIKLERERDMLGNTPAMRACFPGPC